MSQQPLAVELRGPLIDEVTAFQSLAEDFNFALRAAKELDAEACRFATLGLDVPCATVLEAD